MVFLLIYLSDRDLLAILGFHFQTVPIQRQGAIPLTGSSTMKNCHAEH